MKNTTDWRLQVLRLPLAVVMAGFVLTAWVSAEDWPQWRGQDRLAVWGETGIVENLPEELKVTWRAPVRSGFAGPAVADGRVFITDWQEDPESRSMDGTERVIALNEETGEVLWTHEWPTTYRMLMASYAVGPRATPTVDDDRVYVVGATGMLFCLDVETGEVVWSTSYIEDYDTSVPTWGIASAPLVDGNRLITVVGGEPDMPSSSRSTNTPERKSGARSTLWGRWATGNRLSTRPAGPGNWSCGMRRRWCRSTWQQGRSTGSSRGKSGLGCLWRRRSRAETTCW